ncbi:MAG: hypothetical protein R3E95_09845 [Thiolinea sp.]
MGALRASAGRLAGQWFWQAELRYTPAEEDRLAIFSVFCTLFTRQPLIIVLDQFEEFFRYQKGRAAFEPFLEQLTGNVFQQRPAGAYVDMREVLTGWTLSRNTRRWRCSTTCIGSTSCAVRLPRPPFSNR